MSEVALPERDSYVRPWLVTLGLAVGAWLLYSHMTRPLPVKPHPAAVTEQAADWYFVLRMPPITSQYESGIETMRSRYGEWLDALKKAGYRPLLFSELRRLNADRLGVPPRSVVLMFDPGFRRTYGIVSPILQQHNWTAVWMSDAAAMKGRHREYISFHTARQMVASGGWDVGLKKTDGTYTFNIGQTDNFHLGQPNQGTWVVTGGGLGLNHTDNFLSMNCLNVNSDWMAKDLVNRLDAEIPVEAPVYFMPGMVQNLVWGVTQPTPGSFDLAAEPHQRSVIVSWLGTKGINNAKVRLKGKQLAGILSARFRWDEITSSGLQVSITNDKVTVQDWKDGEARPVYKARRIDRSDFSVSLLIVGDRVAIAVDGGKTETIASPVFAGNGKGVAQIYLHDGVLGAARGKNLQVNFEPLSQSAMVFSAGSESL